jgi:hypothetical protein
MKNMLREKADARQDKTIFEKAKACKLLFYLSTTTATAPLQVVHTNL